MYNSLCIKSIE